MGGWPSNVIGDVKLNKRITSSEKARTEPGAKVGRAIDWFQSSVVFEKECLLPSNWERKQPSNVAVTRAVIRLNREQSKIAGAALPTCGLFITFESILLNKRSHWLRFRFSCDSIPSLANTRAISYHTVLPLWSRFSPLFVKTTVCHLSLSFP